MMAMQVKVSPSGNESMAAWREGTHDDLVFAVALACWLTEKVGGVWRSRMDSDMSGWRRRTMALTRAFRETVYRLAREDREFRRALLAEAVEALGRGEEGVARVVFRDVAIGSRGADEFRSDPSASV